MITTTITEINTSQGKAALIEISCPPEGATPTMLKNLSVKVPHGMGVVLSGRAPIWVYGCLVHETHVAKWVATFDPRLEGAVIVESHTPGIIAGEVITVQ